jgi:hypothetical protein
MEDSCYYCRSCCRKAKSARLIRSILHQVSRQKRRNIKWLIQGNKIYISLNWSWNCRPVKLSETGNVKLAIDRVISRGNRPKTLLKRVSLRFLLRARIWSSLRLQSKLVLKLIRQANCPRQNKVNLTKIGKRNLWLYGNLRPRSLIKGRRWKIGRSLVSALFVETLTQTTETWYIVISSNSIMISTKLIRNATVRFEARSELMQMMSFVILNCMFQKEGSKTQTSLLHHCKLAQIE